MERARILIVEDEGIVAEDLAQHLQRLGYRVPGVVASGPEAVQQAVATHPDLVVMDIRLRGQMDGVEAATQIRAQVDIPVVYLTAHADPATLERAKVTAPFGYILKPFEEREVAVTLEMALSKHRMERQLKEREQEIRSLNADLEQRVRERTAQLQAAVTELEAFSDTLVHDLRAPLRATAGFSGILLQEYAPHLPPEAQRYLRLVQTNGEQMGRLVDELLAFAQLNRQSLTTQTVAPVDVVRSALADLHAEQAGRRVKILLGELPPCQASPTLLKQVFTNLLSNALKFTQSREVACIEVGAQQRDGQWIYFVKDNSVGFDMRYAPKLFGVFEWLHPRGEYEGTGIGLAFVQRIVHRHGGQVWAEGAVDQGASFYFTLAGETGGHCD